MNIITQKVIEALDTPSTLKALARKTQYPVHRVLTAIIAARSEGLAVTAVARPELPTCFKKGTHDSNADG